MEKKLKFVKYAGICVKKRKVVIGWN